MSWPQHMGDLILPWPLGHWEICTELPSALVRESFASGESQWAQVAFTAMSHLSHLYVAIGFLRVLAKEI